MAGCYFCPHDATEHGDTGCTAPSMGAGTCSCSATAADLGASSGPPVVEAPPVVPSETALEQLGVDTSQLPPVKEPSGLTDEEIADRRRLDEAYEELAGLGIRKERPNPRPTPANTGRHTGDTPQDTPGTLEDTGAAAPGSPDSDRNGTEPASPPVLEQLPAGAIAVSPVPRDALGRPNPARRQPRTYDWPRIKARYVEGFPDPDPARKGQTYWPTLGEVASHFDATLSRVMEKSAIEGWVGQRQAYQQKLERTRQQVRATKLANDGAALDDRALEVSNLGLRLVHAEMTSIAQRVQQARAEDAGNPSAKSKISSLEMQRLAGAADIFHKIGLRATGIDADVQRLEITGANGAPIEITQELRRDDPARLTGVLAVLEQAGLGHRFARGGDGDRALEAHRGDDGVYSTDPPAG